MRARQVINILSACMRVYMGGGGGGGGNESVCGTLQKCVWYLTKVCVVPYKSVCGTLQKCVWYTTS